MATPRETERLALIKYLFGVALSQTSQPTPQSAVALLQLHDTAELFLVLAAEHLNVTLSRKDLPFLDYWKALRPALGRDLPEYGLMKRLNQARVSFKHHGLLPEERDLQDYSAGVGRFLVDATSMVFETSFDDVSLVDFVQAAEAREHLRRAQQALAQGELVAGLEACAEAFDALVEDYDHRARDRGYHSPFRVGERMDLHDTFHMKIPRSGPTKRLADFVDATARSIEALQQAVRILLLGLDYRRYAQFRGLTPVVVHMFGGGRKIMGSDAVVGCSRDDVGFCIAFVLDSALRLQEFAVSAPAWASWGALARSR